MQSTRTFRKMMTLLACLWAGVFAGPGVSSAPAQSSTPNPDAWVTNGIVRAIAQSGDTTYIGGDFTYVGPNTGQGVPLTASTGQPVPTYPKVLGDVNVSIPDGFGGWYIGGNFTQVGTMPRNRIAHILSNGTVDAAWNPNANNLVLALAVSDTTVYAGGNFTSIGGQARMYVAALDSTTGNATAWNPGADGSVLALAVSGTTVYAGGGFTSIGGQTRNRIAALDTTLNINNATAWNPNANGMIYALAVSGTTVYAGGAFTSINGLTTRNRIAALDAASGTATPWDPNANGVIYALAVSGTTVYAGGSFTSINGLTTRNRIAALDAASGAATPWNPNANGVIYALAVLGTTVYAGGSFTSIGGQTRNYIAALNATIDTNNVTTWNPNANGMIYTLAVSGTTVYAGGLFPSIGGQARNRIAALDASGAATAWNPGANNSVLALVVSGTIVYAGGGFTNIGGQARMYIAALDAEIDTNNATLWNPNANGMIYALAISGTTVYAGGAFTSIGGQMRNGIAALDATLNTNNAAINWNPNPNTGANVRALAVSGMTVYAGGNFTSIGGQTRNRIAALDATGAATAWGPNANNTCVYALAVSGTTVYAGGDFTNIGGQALNRIAALDATGAATAWNPGADGAVTALLVSGSTVYAGGSFTLIGGQTRNYVAGLDAMLNTNNATAWNPSAGAPGVNALAVSETKVCVGGGFTTIGGKPQRYYAQFDFTPSGPTNPGADSITTTMIRWTWWDQSAGETGFKVWSDPGSAAPTTLQTTTAANATYWAMSPLQPNTEYAFQVAATNTYGDSAKTPNYTAWTLAAVPAAPTVNNPTAAALDVAIGAGDGNPAGTQYAIRISPAVGGNAWVQANGSLGASAVWQTVVDWGTKTVTGLGEGTNYTFTAKARNGVNQETAMGPGGSGETTHAPRTLTYNAGPNGSITGDTPQTVSYGGSGSAVTAVPATGYHFAGWSDGSMENPRTDSNVTVDITVTANFAINQYMLTYNAGANGSISGETPQTVNHNGAGSTVVAVPETGYHFVLWSDGVLTAARTDTNVTANITVTASFAINQYTLTYTAGANGSITGPSPQRVDHGSDGAEVTAVPAAGYHFVQWSDASTANPRTDTNVTANITVTAQFAINTYTLTYNADTRGSITGDSPQTVNHGSDGSEVTAVPDTGYHFIQWSDASTANPRTDTNVTADITVTASFAINQYTLTYTAGANGSITGDTPQTVDYGTSGSAVVAVPTLGYHFSNWSDASTANPRTDSNVTSDISVTANFAINQYTLTYNAGPNGSISGTTPQTVEHGANGSAVMAVPDTGFHFVSWSDGSTADLRIDSGVTGDLTVTANFAINSVDTYTLSYTAGLNGTITGDTPQTVERGADGSPVTAVPDPGYYFVNWSDGSAENPRTDVNVTADHSVTANFAINSLTLTYDAGPNGSIMGDTPQTVSYGGNGSAVTAVPATGYHFVGWSDGSTENPRTDSNVTADISVTANFAVSQYTLTYNAGANGSISGETPQTVNHDGAGSTVFAVPETGYHFVQWSDGVLTAARTDTNVTGDLTVTATFAINQYTVAFQTDGKPGATLDGATSQTVAHSDNCAPVTAYGSEGYRFVKWTKGGADYSTDNPLTVRNVTEDMTLTAVFAPSEPAAAKDWPLYE